MENEMIKTVKVGASEMKYFSFGEGEKALVIIPGMSLKSVMPSAGAIKKSYEGFEKTHTGYVFDRIENMPDGYSVNDMARDTAEAMETLGISNADVFGASQGGMIAEVLAIDYPRLVGRLALGSTLSRQNPTSTKTFTEWVKLCGEGDAKKLNHAVFTKVYSPRYYAKYEKAFAVIEKEGTAEEMRRFGIMSLASLTFDCYDRLNKISCPTLAIGAERDEVLSVDGTREIADKTGCKSVIYEEYGHAVYDEAPSYLDRLKEFFA